MVAWFKQTYAYANTLTYGIWCRGLTTCSLCVSPPSGNIVPNDCKFDIMGNVLCYFCFWLYLYMHGVKLHLLIYRHFIFCLLNLHVLNKMLLKLVTPGLLLPVDVALPLCSPLLPLSDTRCNYYTSAAGYKISSDICSPSTRHEADPHHQPNSNPNPNRSPTHTNG